MDFDILDILFIIFAAVTIFGGLVLVTSRNLFRAAIAFVVSLLGSAALFILLGAEFIGAIQILVNVGAVAIIVVVTIMIVGDVRHGSTRSAWWLSILGIVVAVLIFVVFSFAAIQTNWIALVPADGNELPSGALENSVEGIGRLLLRDFVLIFEILAVIVAATVIGAIAVLRRTLANAPQMEGDDDNT